MRSTPSSMNPGLLGVGAALLAALVACTSNQAAGAAAGGGRGALGGAAAGAVSALIFGGDVGEAAARGAVWGGTAGAVGGAVAGTEQDRNEAARAQAEAERELAELRTRIGDDAFAGLGALADCKHGVALAYAQSSAGSSNSDHALAGVWLEVLTHLDAGQDAEVQDLYPVLAEHDTEMGSVQQVHARALDTLETIRDFRVMEGAPRHCNGQGSR